MHTSLQGFFSRRLVLTAFGLTIAVIGIVAFAFNSFAAVGGGVGVGVSPNFPSLFNVGDTGVAVSMDITNTSGTTTPIVLDNIFLTPSCGDFNNPCTTSDP